MQQWLDRCHQQLAVKTEKAVFSLCAVVDREKCPAALDVAALRRLLPQAGALLSDTTLEVQVAAVGERPRLIRVPAGEVELPPTKWETAYLAANKVLVVISFRRHGGAAVPPAACWVRGALPPPEPSALELLRVEYLLPPATRQAAAEKALRAAIRKVAGSMGLVLPAVWSLLRNMQPTHGGVLAIMAVPRAEARSWLRGSGCGGVYLRPFWTAETGRAVQRDAFRLLWVRGRLADGPRLWEAIKDMPGVFGLLPAEKDLAVRITEDADLRALQGHLGHLTGDVKASFRQATPGARWWRLGPLHEADLYRLKELIARTGLTLLRDEVRIAAAGPFRKAAFFAATGDPTSTSLDDGSWGGLAAQLSKAEPPPRRPRTGTSSSPGAALPSQAAWGGPRRTLLGQGAEHVRRDAAAAAEGQRPAVAARPSAAQQRNGDGHQRQAGKHAGITEPEEEVHWPPLRAAAGSQRQRPPRAEDDDRLDQVLAQLAMLTRQNAAMAEEMRELRRDNAFLRRQLEEARGGVQVHQPYAQPVAPPPATVIRDGDDIQMEAAASETEDTMDPDAKRLRSLAAPGRHGV
jgi:hypothetical protein